MNEDIFIMSNKELSRSVIIEKVIGKEVKQKEASQMLRLSERQIRRIVKRVKDEGLKGLLHQGRGKTSSKKISKKQINQILKIVSEKYKDFGPSLASEKLKELDGIRINRESLRQWMMEEGLWQKQRKRNKHRSWRERKAYCGEMVQMDGSHHDWLEGRGSWMVLMGYIDDATNRVYGRFYEYEGTIPAMDSFKQYIKRYGKPRRVYLDKHTTYKSTNYELWKAKLFNEDPPMSQFERALKELNVEVIHAHSAPAKGRVERLFRTLQDRLVKELRLAKATTMEEANEVLEQYLKEHNRRYMLQAKEPADIHEPISKQINLDGILCKKTIRTVRNDFTVAHENRLFQILKYTSAKKVEVRQQINGAIKLIYQDKELKYREIKKMPQQKKKLKLSEKSPRITPKGFSYATYKNPKRKEPVLV